MKSNSQISAAAAHANYQAIVTPAMSMDGENRFGQAHDGKAPPLLASIAR